MGKGEDTGGCGYLHRTLRSASCLTRRRAWCFSINVSFLSLHSSQKEISRRHYLMLWIDYQISHSTRMIKASLFFTPQKRKKKKNQRLRKDRMFHGKDEWVTQRNQMKRLQNRNSQAPERFSELKASVLKPTLFPSSQPPPYTLLSAGSLIPKGSRVFSVLASCRFNIHLLGHIEVICQITPFGQKNVLGYYSLAQMSQTDCLHGGNMPDNYFNHVFPFSCVYMVLVV